MLFKPKNIREAIDFLGHDIDFEPVDDGSLSPTHHEPGTVGKLDVMQDRASRGLPLYHRDDARIDRRRQKPAPVELLEGVNFFPPGHRSVRSAD